jgi:5-methylcytosine-specific restriction endonuclease McrA
MAERVCGIDDCGKRTVSTGVPLCSGHYAAKRRNDPNRPRCIEPDCDRAAVYAKGICQYHYSQTPEQRESHRQASLQWARNNKERGAANTNAWIAANKEKAREHRRNWMRKWRARDPEAARRAFKAWQEANPERWRQLSRAGALKRKALKASTQTEPVDLARVLAEHGLWCHICTDQIEPPDLHFDHVIPLSKGGPHTYDNIRPAHSWCNLRKGTKLLDSNRR